MAAPTFVAVATGSSASTFSQAWPTHQADDVALLFVTTENQAVSTPSGWQTAGLPAAQGTGTAANDASTRLTAFWRRAQSGAESAADIPDSGDVQYAAMLVFRGCKGAGSNQATSPINVSAGAVEATSDTSISLPTVTTTAGDCLIVLALGDSIDSTFARWGSGPTNGALTGIAVHTDAGTTTAGGACVRVASGVKESAGAVGASSATLTVASTKGLMTIALEPEASGGASITASSAAACGPASAAASAVRSRAASSAAAAGVASASAVGAVSRVLASFAAAAGVAAAIASGSVSHAALPAAQSAGAAASATAVRSRAALSAAAASAAAASASASVAHPASSAAQAGAAAASAVVVRSRAAIAVAAAGGAATSAVAVRSRAASSAAAAGPASAGMLGVVGNAIVAQSAAQCGPASASAAAIRSRSASSAAQAAGAAAAVVAVRSRVASSAAAAGGASASAAAVRSRAAESAAEAGEASAECVAEVESVAPELSIRVIVRAPSAHMRPRSPLTLRVVAPYATLRAGMRNVVSGTELPLRLVFRDPDGNPADPDTAWVTSRTPAGVLADTPAVRAQTGYWNAFVLHAEVGLWQHEAHGEGGGVTCVSRPEPVYCQEALR